MKNSPFVQFMRGLIFVSFLIVFFFFKCGGNKENNKSESSTIESSEESLNNNTNTETTSTTCNICGREFYGNGYEEQSDGTFKELEYPYSNQICSPSCGRKHVQNINSVARKYGVELDEQNSKSSPNTQGDYHVGKDGRVYENNKCTLCKGTGVEKGRNVATGEPQGRICPMCDGKGVRSY